MILLITFFIPMIYEFRDSYATRYNKLNKLRELLDEYTLKKK